GWFAGGRRFWIERWDNRQVGEAWVINSLQRPRPTLTSMRLAFPGEANLPIPELWVGDLDAGTLVQIDTSRWPGQLISGTEIGGTGAGNISSAGSADRLYFVRISRGYQDVELVIADAETGRTRVLLHEKSEPYFSIRTPLFRFLNDGSFLWLSDRTGWNHLYRYDANGTLLGSVTGGDFNVAEILHVDAGRGWIYFKGFGRERGRNPYFEHTYRVRTDGTRLSLLTPEDAAHTTSISPNGRWLVDVYSRPDQVPQAVVRASDGKRRYLLEQLDIRSLVAGGWSAPESFTATAADGKTTLHGTLWKPHRFDPQRRYPVIAYVTPNPNYIGHIAVRFNPATRFESLAQLGFIVAAASTRGQGQGIRDKAFLVHGRGDVRDYPLADSKTALEQAAASRPYMDLSRAGVTGYSGGGLMAASLLLTYPDFYKAAVSGAGNHDNNIYDWASGEHYFGNGVPGTALAQTRMSTNQELAANLQGDLLLVHSDTDRNVPMTHSLRLADALVDAGKRFDFLVIPGRDHNLRDRWSYYDRVVWCYFAQRLLGDERQCVDLWKLH
ncbi:S9 family peptidase, partial [Steroidobacter sp.]|uniref:S9 family peptidase n=1 Tax=Steroidobacter sp. TaxID=1978227 RepID=UPI001A4E6836